MGHEYKRIAGMIWSIALCTSASNAQQQFTQTVTKANKNCNATCSVFDVPAINNNPAAVIFIMPVGNATRLNPHPIGAYYMYLKKWSVFNLDGAPITEGAKYDVQYFADSGPDRFVYMVPRQVYLRDIPYIDREGLNGNPNAQVRVFPTSYPTHGAFYNRGDVKVEYDSNARLCVPQMRHFQPRSASARLLSHHPFETSITISVDLCSSGQSKVTNGACK